MDQVQHPCECHVCNQGNGDGRTSGLNSIGLPTSRLHAGGHQFFSEKTAAHPALHLYPHMHSHLPLHNLSHLPRPLLPTLYSTPPLTHSKVRSTHVHKNAQEIPSLPFKSSVGEFSVIFLATRGVTCTKNHNLKKDTGVKCHFLLGMSLSTSLTVAYQAMMQCHHMFPIRFLVALL